MNRHLLTFSIVLFVTSLAHGMDKLNKPHKKRREIQFFQHMPFTRIFDENIPSEVSGKVFDLLCFTSPTLWDGARCINHFSGVSKSMNILIKDNTMPLVKKLSEVYKCSNEAAARALQTKTARKIVLKQLGFAAICLSEEWHKQVSPQDSHLMKKSNSDLNFTYEKNGETLLMVASKCVVNGRARQGLFEWLIKNGADITVADRCGSTVPYMALDASSYHEDQQLIEYLWDHPYFNINDIRWYGYKKTLLMHIVLLLHSSNQDFDQYELRGERSVLLPLLHKLLAKGADPELGGISDSGDFVLTPLSLAEQFKDQEVINIIRDAIVRKHAQKHTQ